MKFIIIAVQTSLFNNHLLPILELTVYAEEMMYAIEGFERNYPSLELLDIN